MRTIKFLLVILLFCPLLSTGQKNSWDGYNISPRSKFRVLNICINVIYDVNTQYIQTNNEHWPEAYTEGVNNESIPDNLLDFMDTVYTPGNSRGYITRFFGESSFDAFQIIGDFVVVNVKESRVLTYGSFGYGNIIKAAIALINQNGLQTIYGHNKITDYDYEKNNKIYFTHVIFRNITKIYGGIDLGSGYGGSPIRSYYGNLKIGSTFYPFSGKGIIVGSMTTPIVLHEIGHSLLGGSEFHASGGNHRGSGEIHMPFFTLQVGYGVMAGGRTLVSCNGYDRWRMHWKHAQAPYYISARNSSNNGYVNSDISKANGNVSFILRDFVTYGDAIRIKLPYKDSEAASNQYIWLENHKTGLNNKLDYLHYSDDAPCRPRGNPGVYAYYQIGRDILSGASSEVWFTHERDNLRMITAEGYWDYSKHYTNPYNMQCITWAEHDYVLRRDWENPFCGYHDLETHFYPDNSDNTLMLKHECAMWRKMIGTTIIDSLASSGDNRDVFSGYNKINMGTNPSTCNAKAYYNWIDESATSNFTSQAHRNNLTTYLTGLSIEMIPQSNKDVLVNIRWDDYNVTNKAWWTGKISNKEKVNLTSGNYIVLAQNKTPSQPYRDAESRLFAQTTVLTCEENSVFTQQSNSAVTLLDRSKLLLKSGSEYTIMQDAILQIPSSCKLEVEDCAILRIKGSLLIGEEAIINIHPNALIIIDEQTSNIDYRGDINTLFPVYINENSVFTGNSVINQNTTLNNVYVESGATLTIQNATVKFLPDAKVIVKPGGKLILDGAILTLANVCNGQLWQGIEVWGDPKNTIQISSYQGTVYLQNGATIENAIYGISAGEMGTSKNGGGIIIANNARFINNWQAVYFAPYEGINTTTHNPVSNSSKFNNCEFLWDDRAKTLFSFIYNAQVELNNVHRVSFKNCRFNDFRTGKSERDFTIGIYANASSIILGNQPFLYPLNQNHEGCVFTAFSVAVDLFNSDYFPHCIYFTEFNENIIGVYTQAVNNVTVEGCAFTIPNTLSFSRQSSYGIYLHRSTGYKIENNYFRSGGEGATGIYIDNSGIASNTIKNNTFRGLCTGCNVNGINANEENGTGSQGLVFLCNSYDNNGYDISIEYNSNIRYIQSGGRYSATGNTFSNSVRNISYRNFGHLQYYYLSADPALHLPQYLGNVQVDCIPVGHDCCNGFYGNAWENYYNITEAPISISDLEYKYQHLSQVYLDLKNIYISNGYGDRVINLEDVGSEQFHLYYDLTDLKYEMDNTCYKALKLLSTGDCDNFMEQYRMWVGRINTIESSYLLVDSYISTGEFRRAEDILREIPDRFKFYREEDWMDHGDYRLYSSVAMEYYSLRENTEIPHHLIDILRELSVKDNLAGIKSLSMLESVAGFNTMLIKPRINCTNNNCSNPYSLSHKNASIDNNTIDINPIETEQAQQIEVYPNPANSTLSVKLTQEAETSVQYHLYDIQGKELINGNFNGQEYKIDISQINKGIYFIAFTIENQVRIVKKIIKE